MNRFREIVAKYDSSCGECGDPLPKGGGVWWKKSERVRCAECTPYEDRALSASLDDRKKDRERAAAKKRKAKYFNPFYRIDRNGPAASLLKELVLANDTATINSIADRIDAVASPLTTRERRS